ncbi:MAG: peptidoglycan DD-metalloendopeptidase family protein [Treponema sp.]|nr:peptidoglycan DD-metalloendopeptidase family protein [Candidatus Treponema equifaecale]
MKKALVATGIILTAVLSLWAFDWPQTEIMADSFFSYFGQYRGGTISTSLVFTDSDEIKAAESGRILALISEHGEDELFESTLGNAAIIIHKDNLATVYANLDSEKHQELFSQTELEKGAALGNTSNSGWQKGEACLEFQVLDTKNQNYINPRILMPRVGKELELSIKNVSAVNKKGTEYDLSTQKNLNSGTYLLYKDQENIAVPYKTTVFVNGAAAESIAFDTLTAKDGRICATGKKAYSASVVYPNSKRQFLGEVTLPKGKNTVSIVVADILGKEKQLTYTLEVR